jgi:multiple sugar transport system permease protein
MKTVLDRKDVDVIAQYGVNMKLRRLLSILWSIFRFFLLLGLSYIILYPILFMLSTSFRGVQDFYDPAVVWIPLHFTFGNIGSTIQIMDYWNVLRNSTTFTLINAIIQTSICAFVGYGFARFNFLFKNIMIAMVIFTIIVPVQTIIVPLYEQLRYFDFFGISDLLKLITGINMTLTFTNTGWIYYLPSLFGNGIRSGLFILVFMQFFRGFPVSIEEATLIDGCNQFKCFFRVIIPNSLTAIITVMLFSVVWIFNDYYYGGVLLSSKVTLPIELAALPIQVMRLTTGNADPVANSISVQVGCLLTILPLLVIFIFCQKFFVESVERTGMVE